MAERSPGERFAAFPTSRRGFLRAASALGAAGLAVGALGPPRGPYAQFEARFADEPGAVLRRLTLSYLNPFDGPERPVSQEQPSDGASFPFPFRSRAEWGCDESLRFDAAGAESWPRMYVPVK